MDNDILQFVDLPFYRLVQVNEELPDYKPKFTSTHRQKISIVVVCPKTLCYTLCRVSTSILVYKITIFWIEVWCPKEKSQPTVTHTINLRGLKLKK